MSGDTLPFPGGDFPRLFGVPGGVEPRSGSTEESGPCPSFAGGCKHCGWDYESHVGVDGAPARGRVAGPESAVEHLRNGLMLIDNDFEPVYLHGVPMWVYPLLSIHAVRRRVVAALAQLECP